MKQIDIDKKYLGILLKKLLIWNLDNPDGILDEAVTKFKEVELLKEIVVPNKKINLLVYLIKKVMNLMHQM